MKLWKLLFVLPFVTAFTPGCTTDDNDVQRDAMVIFSDGAVAQAQRACGDLFEALVGAFVRCGADEEDTRTELASAVDCTRVVAVRDEEELRTKCFPELKTFDCKKLAEGELIESCKGQLLNPDRPGGDGGTLGDGGSGG